MVVGPDGSILELRPTGPALGLLPEAAFGAGEGTLERGATLLAFTDGLVEARSPAGAAFGSERLRDALRANSTSASDLVRGVLEALRVFTGQAEPHDDVLGERAVDLDFSPTVLEVKPGFLVPAASTVSFMERRRTAGAMILERSSRFARTASVTPSSITLRAIPPRMVGNPSVG